MRCQPRVAARSALAKSAAPRSETLPSAAVPPDGARWQAALRRDGQCDGEFVFAVKTTGVYCRPSRPSRLPLRDNVALFDTATAARAAGFRACKRCAPDGARGEQIRHMVADSPLGPVIIAAKTKGLCMVEFGDSRDALLTTLQARFPRATLQPVDAEFSRWARQVLACVAAPALAVDLPKDVRGTPFPRQVWEELRAIPVGQTACYRQIAARVGKPSGARAVARACASNPVVVIVTCHRVSAMGGGRAGYRWRLDRKEALLAQEAAG